MNFRHVQAIRAELYRASLNYQSDLARLARVVQDAARDSKAASVPMERVLAALDRLLEERYCASMSASWWLIVRDRSVGVVRAAFATEAPLAPRRASGVSPDLQT